MRPNFIVMDNLTGTIFIIGQMKILIGKDLSIINIDRAWYGVE